MPTGEYKPDIVILPENENEFEKITKCYELIYMLWTKFHFKIIKNKILMEWNLLSKKIFVWWKFWQVRYQKLMNFIYWDNKISLDRKSKTDIGNRLAEAK